MTVEYHFLFHNVSHLMDRLLVQHLSAAKAVLLFFISHFFENEVVPLQKVLFNYVFNVIDRFEGGS